MNYIDKNLLDIKSYEDKDFDSESVIYYNVVLNEDNIYSIPSKPVNFDNYYYVAFYGDSIYIATDEYEETILSFGITKFVLRKLV